jgi:peptide/nickel transport system substrate-binding protein
MTKTRWSRREFLRRMAETGAGTIALGTAGGALVACGNAAQTGGSAAAVAPVRGGSLVEGSIQDILGLNPVLLTPGISSLLSSLLFEGLLANDSNGTLLPALASALPRVSADGLTYTIPLRRDVRWSDGQPLTAEDVVFTYDLMFDPGYGAVRSPYRTDLLATLAGITAPDPYTVVFTLKQPSAPFLATHGLHGILPKHVLGSLTAAEINSADFNRAPSVVSGVFKFVEWAQGDHVTLARNDSYYAGAAHLDQYVFKVVAQDQDVVNLLETGALDCSRLQTTALFAPLDAQPALSSVTYPVSTVVTWFYNLNPARPAGRIFASAKVRQALALAVDRQALISSVYFGVGARLADEFFLPNSWAFDGSVTPRYRVDTKKAQQLLDQEGWVKGSDGVRVKDGQRMSFEIVTSANSKEYGSDAQVMQQAWRSIGADVSLKAVAYTQEIQLADFTHAFDVIVFNVNQGLDPDLTNYWSTRGYGTGGLNASGYTNPEVDRLFQQATATTDQAKRRQLYAQVSGILARDVPAVPIVYPQAKFYFNKRVHGLQSIGTYTVFGPRRFMKDVFVTKS